MKLVGHESIFSIHNDAEPTTNKHDASKKSATSFANSLLYSSIDALIFQCDRLYSLVWKKYKFPCQPTGVFTFSGAVDMLTGAQFAMPAQETVSVHLLEQR